MKTVPLRHLTRINTRVLPENTASEHTFKYIDISQVDSNGALSLPDEDVSFGEAPSRARRLASAGDTVVSTVRTYLRAITRVPVTSERLVVSTGFAVLEPVEIESRFLTYACRSEPFVAEVVARSTGVSYPAINPSDLVSIALPVPEAQEQRRIADFLDDRVARIDRIIAARRDQMEQVGAASLRASFDTVRGSSSRERRPSGVSWLGTIPRDWALLSVTSEFQVDLGKMLDEKQQTGLYAIPYLRNTNVQWDRVDLDDLKSMDIAPDERPRYMVERGDLLICEGGQPGRAAIWCGGLEPLGYQKALHRARSRGRSRPDWLLECLRAATAMNVFAVEYEQATISHLTNEQLRSFKIPCPEPQVQDELLSELRITQEWARSALVGLARSIDLLSEYKQSLITAAVTGELGMTTTGSGIPE